MNETAAGATAQPQPTVAVPKLVRVIQPPLRRQERIHHVRLAVDEPSDSPGQRNQKDTSIVFGEALNAVRLLWQRVEFRSAGLPSPQPVGATSRSDPEVACTVLINADRANTRTTIVTAAFSVAWANLAERPSGIEECGRPNRAFMVLDEFAADITSG